MDGFTRPERLVCCDLASRYYLAFRYEVNDDLRIIMTASCSR